MIEEPDFFSNRVGWRACEKLISYWRRWRELNLQTCSLGCLLDFGLGTVGRGGLAESNGFESGLPKSERLLISLNLASEIGAG